jgi:choline-glycine betaine transporter
VTAVVVMVLVAIFFVSGADAASIVMGTLSEKGRLEPSKQTVVFWGAATGTSWRASASRSPSVSDQG